MYINVRESKTTYGRVLFGAIDDRLDKYFRHTDTMIAMILKASENQLLFV